MVQEIKFQLKNGMTLEINERGFCLFNTDDCWVLDASDFAENGTISVDTAHFSSKNNSTDTLIILKEK